MTVRAELHDGTVLEFPDGTSDEVVSRTVKTLMGGGQPAAPDRSFGEEALRKAEFGARGVSDSVLETIGAIPDAVGSGMRALGLPSSDPGFYTNGLKAGWNALGRTLSAPLNTAFPDVMSGPQTAGDKLAYGAGRGVGDAASVVVPAAGVSRAAQAGGLTERVASALAAQPGIQAAAGAVGGGVGQATDSPLTGLLASMAVPGAMAGAGRLASPVRAQLGPEQARLAAAAQAEGIQLTPGQMTGSKPLQTMEAVFGTLPMTSGPQREIADAQRVAFNRAALARAGVQADRAAPDVMDDAFRALGQRFDDLAAATTVQVDHKLFQDVDKVVTDYGRRLPTDVAPVFQSYVDDLNQMRAALGPAPAPGSVVPAGQAAQGASVQIPGDAFQNVVSDIRRRARSTSNPDLQRALNELADKVNDNMIRSSPPEVADGWRQARRDYRNLLAIDNAMGQGTQAERSAGNIPFAGLRSAVKADDKSGYSRGRGDLNDLTRIADFLGSSRLQSSGTSERTAMINMLTGSGLTGGGVGAVAGGADPLLSLAATAGAAVLPRAVQAAYNSPAGRAWLTNQAAAGLSPPPALLGSILLGREKDALLGGPRR
ncbi:hypothetical protein [Azospirillum picis]|uniref:Uncharacterized protein n=1 Tax=Azospirillum picis TaxID=488438 RepID=A0ABU0MPL4_9PROT|nr:hypothetical protein [Azospirillum picis]MBP2301580.1 hypothetical protein [Azospirillum picis]MDQ0535412.1 hypothetical protein [Azospirillum picis]